MPNSKSSSIPRMVLFLMGLAIVCIALVLLRPYSFAADEVKTFTAVDVIVLYLLLFGPPLLSEQIHRLTGGRLVSLGIYWYAVSAYTVLTAWILYHANFSLHPPLRIYIVVQLVGLFGVAIATYLGCFAHGYIQGVEESQQAVRNSVDALRANSSQLAVVASCIDPTRGQEYAEVARSLQKIQEELRYLSPVDTADASYLEQSISEGISSLLMLVGTGGMSEQAVRDAKQVADETLLAIARRKTLRG